MISCAYVLIDSIQVAVASLSALWWNIKGNLENQNEN